MVPAGGVQDVFLVVVTIVVINYPEIGYSVGHVELQVTSSSECRTLIKVRNGHP